MRWLLVWLVSATPAAAQALELTPERDSVTVGDSVPVRVRLRLDERDLLLDSTPRPAGALPRGVRLLAAAPLARQPDRTFSGQVVVALYRPGRRVIPPFMVSYRRNVTLLGGTVRSEPVGVVVVPVLSGGGSTRLRDIKELEPVSGTDLLPAVLLLASLAAVGLWLRRPRRPRPSAGDDDGTPTAPRPGPGALRAALDRLERVEAEDWPTRGDVARHYEAVIDVLRDYVAATEGIPARERTTAELLRSISRNGVYDRCRDLLLEADLVKFAALRPAGPAPRQFLHATRQLLQQWDASHAVR